MLASHITKTTCVLKEMYVNYVCELDFKMSDVTVRELLHFIVGAGSVVFNWNLQKQNTLFVSLKQLKNV